MEAIWSKYDWTKVTTIVPVGYVNSHLMCFAHKHGARVVTIGMLYFYHSGTISVKGDITIRKLID